MLHKLTQSADQLFGFDAADAHCDIPCKIYDPAVALIAALSVVRMVDILNEAAAKDPGLDRDNTISRCIALKEVEAAKVKEEVRVIWSDYFKAPQIEAHPNVHSLVHSILMTASKCKQTVDRAAAEELVELVNQFAEMFWQTKGVETERKEAPYPPSMAVVRPV
ncbi:MAG: superoxide dismutase, Ni [Rhodospirillaceae bacterium]